MKKPLTALGVLLGLAANCQAGPPVFLFRPPAGGVFTMDYEFVLNVDRWVAVYRGDFLLIGKLDKNGDFTHEFKFSAGSAFSGGIPAPTLLTGAREKPAYEFRSGRLVPGVITYSGFIPDLGGKIILFSDYRYSPTAIHIWNLPGGFQPVRTFPLPDKK